MPEQYEAGMFVCDFKVITKDTNNISYAVRYGLGGKAQSVRNLPCMQIFVIWAQASWQ